MNQASPTRQRSIKSADARSQPVAFSHEEVMADMRAFQREVTASPSAALAFLRRAGLITADGKPRQLIRA
jgi:hypothetical protein